MIWPNMLKFLRDEGASALVTLIDVKGSAPRDAGTRMVISPAGKFYGTIGGGALEWETIEMARSHLAAGANMLEKRVFPLGPDLGQCCGGAVTVLIETFNKDRWDDVETLCRAETAGQFHTSGVIQGDRVDRTVAEKRPIAGFSYLNGRDLRETFGTRYQPLYLFGAGHVGKALMLALAPLPFQVTWIDSREDAFPDAMPGNFTPVRSESPARLLADAPEDAFILALTHNHDLDFDIAYAALKKGTFPYVGVIGSMTKRARFQSKMRKAGMPDADIERMVCPIGIKAIASKLPAVIAASVAAELLMVQSTTNREQVAQ